MQVLRTVDTCADHERIQFTVCMLICKFSCWLANSAVEDPSLAQLVPLLFKHSILSLNKHVSAGGASLAFAALCRDSAPSIAAHCSSELMDTFESAASIESATWRRRAGSITMSTMPLEEEDVCSIVEGTATVLAHAAANGSQEVCCAYQTFPSSCLGALVFSGSTEPVCHGSLKLGYQIQCMGTDLIWKPATTSCGAPHRCNMASALPAISPDGLSTAGRAKPCSGHGKADAACCVACASLQCARGIPPRRQTDTCNRYRRYTEACNFLPAPSWLPRIRGRTLASPLGFCSKRDIACAARGGDCGEQPESDHVRRRIHDPCINAQC